MSPDDLHDEGQADCCQLRDVEYALVLGFRPLLLDLMIPRDPPGRKPVVLYIHPGAWLTGSHKADGRYRCAKLIIACLLEAGLAVASVQYRLAGEARFPACLQDVAAAVRWLRRFAPDLGLRGDRIGCWGESCGGHLAVLLATNLEDDELLGANGVTGVPSTVQAAVNWYGVTDFLALPAQALAQSKVVYNAPNSPASRLLGVVPTADPDLARRASPIALLGPATAPMHFVHGENNSTTPPLQTQTMADALKAADVYAERIVVPGVDHQLVGTDSAPFAARSAAFLATRLKSDGSVAVVAPFPRNSAVKQGDANGASRGGRHRRDRVRAWTDGPGTRWAITASGWHSRAEVNAQSRIESMWRFQRRQVSDAGQHVQRGTWDEVGHPLPE